MTETKAKQPMTRSGFCQFPSTAEHAGCRKTNCDCACHEKEEA